LMSPGIEAIDAFASLQSLESLSLSADLIDLSYLNKFTNIRSIEFSSLMVPEDIHLQLPNLLDLKSKIVPVKRQILFDVSNCPKLKNLTINGEMLLNELVLELPASTCELRVSNVGTLEFDTPPCLPELRVLCLVSVLQFPWFSDILASPNIQSIYLDDETRWRAPSIELEAAKRNIKIYNIVGID